MSKMKLQLTCANIPGAMDRLNRWGITVYDYETVDEITAVFSIDTTLYTKMPDLSRYGCRVQILQDRRISCRDIWKRRWVLMIGIAAMLFLTFYIPTKVLFFRVEGAASVPEKLILEKAEVCGLRFGASRREVRSERVKNQLLQLLPQLQWAGINTQGCVAVISVEERQPEESEQLTFEGVGNIVCARDGVIQSVTVLQGSSRCKPGQAVRKGEILISGYTDCNGIIRAEAAQGEVYAMTNRVIHAIAPHKRAQKGSIISEERKYSILIGKKRINLYKDSGILGTTCDKMYSYSYVTLPGGFQLPLALIREKWITWQPEAAETNETETETLLTSFSEDYLLSQMVSGQILDSDVLFTHREDHSVLSGSYACSEMIGQILYEERFQEYGENN